MIHLVNITDADRDPGQLVDRVAAGEDVVIARDGKALVRLVPVSERAPRVAGLFKHLIRPEPAGAFDPLTDAELADWE